MAERIDLEPYSKQAKDLIEGDVVRLSTGDGLIYYYIDNDVLQYEDGQKEFECFIYEITEEELSRYFTESDISFRDDESRMEPWVLGHGQQYVTCVDTKRN